MMRNKIGILAILVVSAAVSACDPGGDEGADGGDGGLVADGGAAAPDAGASCTEPGHPCEPTHYCEAATGQCKQRCDALISADAGNPCVAPQVCSSATGQCEAACDNDDCISRTPAKLCDENVNDCADPDGATGGCSIASSSSLPAGHAAIPTHQAGGVFIFNATGTDDGVGADGCGAADRAYAVSFEYRDLSGNAVSSTVPDTAEGPLWSAMQVWKQDAAGITWKQGFDNLVSFGDGATLAAGTVKVAFCYGAAVDAPEQMLISVEDRDGMASNRLCVPF